jgi:hypothetical protein
MVLSQLQLTSHASSTLYPYQKIKINKLSSQDSSLVIKVQLSLCMQTAQIGRCVSKIVWEALLVKERVAEVRKDRKMTGTKGYSNDNVHMYV